MTSKRFAQLICVTLFGCSALAATGNLALVSDETWEVFTTNGLRLVSVGMAQPVCLNATTPSPCPAGSTIYGNPSTTAWPANLSSIPGAKWIWAPGITGATQFADLNEFRFSKTFNLPSVPPSASIAIAVDSAARIAVNGVTVGTIGSASVASLALAAQSSLTVLDIRSRLVAGSNNITVIAQNGSRTLSGCASACTYAQNPAGVVFGAMIGFPPPPDTYLGEGSRPTNPTLVEGVNTATGNFYYTALDLRVRSRTMPFTFRRHYNSLDSYSGPFGQGWTHTYNVHLSVAGGVVTLKEADGQEVLFSLVASGECPPITPGVLDVLTRNTDGTLVLMRRDRMRLQFSAAGRMTSTADRNGNAFTFAYDTVGKLISILDIAGRAFTLAYNASGRIVSLTDPAARRISYSYDPSGRLLSVTDPVGGVTRYVYDAQNRIVSASDSRAVTFVQNAFDAQGRVVESKDAAGAITRFAYNTPVPGTTTRTDPLLRVTRFAYDSAFRLLSITDALGGVTRYEYDSQNRKTSETDANGFKTEFGYDSRGNRTSIRNPLGHTITLTYDAQNNLTSSTDGAGRTTTFTYDANGNRTSMTNPVGTTHYQYGSRGNLTSITDALERQTLFTYDTANNLETVTDPRGRVTRYGYDSLNNKTSATNGRSNTTTYTYDLLNRVTSSTDPMGGRTEYAYDALGNLISIRNPIGTVNRFTYDNRNDLTEIRYSNGSGARFTYNPVRRRVSMLDPLGTTTYTYDALDRLTGVNSPGSKVVSYTYDPVGNRTSITYPDSKTVSYAYDAANRLVRVTDWMSRNSTYAYNGAGQPVTITYPALNAISFAYDAAGRLDRVQNLYAPSTALPPTSLFQYVLDAVGNRTQVTNAAGAVTGYGFDAADQLSSVSGPSGTTTFGYDAAGNRTSRTTDSGTTDYGYDAADRLVSAGSTTYTHNLNGNVTSRSGPSGVLQYAYDSANRLIRVTGPGISSSFVYDGDGYRRRQRTAAGTYDYVLDIASPLVSIVQENGPDGLLSYVRGRGQTPISFSTTGLDRFYHYDGLGTVVGLANAGGLQEVYTTDVWGGNTAAPAPGAATRNKFRFLAEPQDPETGLYHLRARYYDPDLGRFLTKDPEPGFAREPLSQNPYIYSLNNPLRYSDRTGRYPDWYDDPWSDQESYSSDSGVDDLDPPDWPFQPAWP